MNGQQVKSLSLTIKLLKTIGSPFAPEQKQVLPENKEEALELYEYATKNKIGLAYLESLKNQERLGEFGLKGKYEEEKKKHDEQQVTASRISELFNSHRINYAIFKSIMPFPATPNDVDIIHFGSDGEFERAVELLLKSNYMEVKQVLGKNLPDSSQRMFHDTRDGKIKDCMLIKKEKKDVYDVDVYQEIAASHILYLDKRKLEKYVIELNTSNNKLKVLRPEAELVAIIIHSIIPEMLCTLFVYYATLYHLEKMNSEEIDRFIDIAKENNVTFPVRTHFSLVAELHNAANGFVPEKIEEILAELGNETREKRILLKNNLKMPHKYSLSAVSRVLLEKSKEAEFRRSAIKQMIYMSNPKLTKWVIYNIIWRRMRETY